MLEASLKDTVIEKSGIPFEAGLHLADLLAIQDFDAAFCTEDMLAVGVLHGLLEKGVCVGKDFRLVGFDNIQIGRQVYPQLTTVDQNIFEKGETAIKTLLKILKKKSSTGSRLVLPVNLVSRETA